VALVVVGLIGSIAACAAGPQGTAEQSPARAPVIVAQAPPVGLIPPNGSRITATVRGRRVWPPGSLTGTRPAVRPNVTLYSLTLDVATAAPTAPTVENMARPGEVIEAFSFDPLAEDLVGKTITAVVELTGTTLGTRWLISRIEPNR